MYFVFKIVQVCFLTTLIETKQTTSYVLFAADIDDFRTMAKKFVPDKLVEQLARMASESALKQKQNTRTHDYYESNESYEDANYETPADITIQQPTLSERSEKPKLIQQELSKINLDELVEKVKERLAKEYGQIVADKYKETTRDKQLYVYVPKGRTKQQNEEYEDTTPYGVRNTMAHIEQVHDTSSHSERTEDYNKVTTPTYEWYNKEPEFEKTNIKVDKYIIDDYKDKNDMFREMDLTKTKDSYEDYVTPKKDKVYESSETTKKINIIKGTRFIKVTNKPEDGAFGKWKKVGDKRMRTTKSTTPEYQYEDEQSEKHEAEIKARTESLVYEERFVNNEKKTGSRPRTKGTNIPKRDYYKLSSPNYFAQHPNVAERYDFNEPIPERDREHENLKPIGNPPAFINKKVRLL